MLMWSGLDVAVSVCEWAMAELVENPEMQVSFKKSSTTWWALAMKAEAP